MTGRTLNLSSHRQRQSLMRQLMLGSGICIAFVGTAHAQQESPTPSAAPAESQTDQAAADQGSDIVVTGYRGSIEASLRQKREANAFIDVITAEDVGKFPDKNVADALQRVPGIVIDREGGEGSRVSIRGLNSDLTLTELNGNFIASAGTLAGTANPSRSFSYVLLPSNMIASVDVFKSPEARLDEGGVGGTIILHTRRPLDLKPWSGFVSAEGTDSDVSNKVEPQLSGQLSWRNEAGTIGLLVGGTWQRRTNREMDASTETWQWWTDGDRDTGIKATDVNGHPYANDDAVTYWSQNRGETTQSGQHYNGYWAPQSVDAAVLNDRRERIGIQATLDLKPADNLRITANYYRFQLNSRRQMNQLKIPEWGYDNFFTDAKFDKSGTVMTSATFQVPAAGTGCLQNNPICTMETPQIYGQYIREKDVSNTFDVRGDWNLGRLDVSFVLGKTKATGGPEQEFHVASKPRLTGSVTQNGNLLSAWDFSNGGLNMNFSPELQQNIMNGIAQIDTGSTGSGFTNSTIEQRYAQVDVTRHFDSFIDSIQVGAKWRDGHVRRETGEFDWYADPATKLLYQDTAAGAVAQPSFFYGNPIGNIPGGFKASSFPGINLNNYLNFLNSTYGDAVKVPQAENLYNIEERIWAGYAQVNFKSGPVRGNIGLRVANTKQSGRSTDTIYQEVDYCVDGPGGPFDPNRPIGPDGNCQVIPLNQREIRSFSPNNEFKSYTDVLPSFNISWDVTDKLLVRGAVSKVIARPSFDNLASARSLTFRSDAYTFDRAQFGEIAGWSGDGGNFDLQPFSAWAYDLGVEWYFHPGSVLGAALFRKDVKNFVVPLVIDVTQNVQGQDVLVQQYTTQANGSSAVSEGVELYAQHTLSFGLGAQVNFTYNHTSVADVSLNGTKIGTSPLVGSAKTQWNASIFYEKGPVLLRASYNRRGERVGALVSGLNVYDDPFEQVDLNASFEVFHNFTITGSVINLTKSTQSQHLGNDTSARFYGAQYTGRRFYLGAAYKF